MIAPELQYLTGFGNQHASEALPGALPRGQNSPQRCPYGLYAEQFSGTAFTAPRRHNRRSWLYRIRPSVVQGRFRPLPPTPWLSAPLTGDPVDPNPMRWNPLPIPKTPCDFIDGLFTFAANGRPDAQAGCAVHLYALNADMQSRYLYDADAELLIVPQSGELLLRTELGQLHVPPGHCAVLPRGIKFQVRRAQAAGSAHGYVCENFGAAFELPELGPIGANGLANPRDFETPVACYDDIAGNFELVARVDGRLWSAPLNHSPLDVVAWHGNQVPYRYDLSRFNSINTVSFDHPDPSIFTVLTAPSDTPGTANVDFVIFPPRWVVAEHSFRPPWFHRNVMSEFMGLVQGRYDAKASGFIPGGSSLHNCMSAHGPDADTFESASQIPLAPQHLDDSLAFMFESRYPFRCSEQARNAPFRQMNYSDVWQDLRSQFDPGQP